MIGHAGFMLQTQQRYGAPDVPEHGAARRSSTEKKKKEKKEKKKSVTPCRVDLRGHRKSAAVFCYLV